MERVWREVEAAGARRRPRRPFRLRAGDRLAQRRPGRDLRRPGRRHARLAAARRPGLRLRPDVRAGRLRHDLRRDGSGREAPHQPPRRCVPQAGGGAAANDRRAARALRPLAVLRQQMPLLRLQQPCPLEHRPGCVARRAARRPRARSGAAARTPPDLDLLRRRDAVADGAGDRRGNHRGGADALEPRRATSKSRSRPTPTRSRRRASPISRRPGSIACRSGCRASTTRPSPSSAARIRRARVGGRWRSRSSTSARVSFDLIYALPGETEASWAATLAQALSLGTTHLSLYQLTIEPGTRFATMVAERQFEPLDADAPRRCTS